MLIVQKGNRQLKVDDHLKENYLADGWDILDEDGKVLFEAPNPLKSKVTTVQKEVINILIGIDVGKELNAESLEKLAVPLGIEFESKAKSAEAIQKAYDLAMAAIKL